MKKTINIVLAVLLIVTGLLFAAACNKVTPDDIKNFSTGNDVLRVGILSDSQLPYSDDGYTVNIDNLTRSFAVLKENDVDMIMFAGDICNNASDYAYQTFLDCFDNVFGEDKPILQTVMGNHDYWGKGVYSIQSMRKLYSKYFGVSPWTHLIVDGYHFIGASPDCGDTGSGYEKVTEWLTAEIDKAVADDPQKPIFVMTHNYPVDTAYGSDEWGDSSLAGVLDDYPQVVLFGGHSHYSILDERSIWQDGYTVINTQSVSYTELESGKVNGTIPPDASATPMGYIMTVSDSEVQLLRMNFATGNEEKSDNRWTLTQPMRKENFAYTDAVKTAANTAPEINDTSYEIITENGVKNIKFAQGNDDDFVHSYKVVIENFGTLYYFSDFYNGIEDMSNYYTIPLEGLSGGSYDVRIYAVDSFGLISEDYIRATISF